MKSINADKELIEANGGASVLARKLNYQVSRVQNWKVRGIPPQEKLNHPEIFLTSSLATGKTNDAIITAS